LAHKNLKCLYKITNGLSFIAYLIIRCCDQRLSCVEWAKLALAPVGISTTVDPDRDGQQWCARFEGSHWYVHVEEEAIFSLLGIWGMLIPERVLASWGVFELSCADLEAAQLTRDHLERFVGP
jgi:hypothetical protein